MTEPNPSPRLSGPDRLSGCDLPSGAGRPTGADRTADSDLGHPARPDRGPGAIPRTDPDRAATIMRQWQRERPDLDPASVGVVSRVWQLARIFSTHRRSLLTDLGIDSALLDLLGTLRRSGHPYRLTTRELAQAAGVTPAAISQRLTRAEQRGWVHRVPAPGRRVEVHLTEPGRAMADEFAGAVFEADEALVAHL